MRAARRARIVGDADLRQGRCLEIGPLANPVVGAEVADVRYVDVVDRTGLVAHYAGNPAVDPDAIPEQHFWLTRPDGTVSTLAEAVAADAPYQHVVASHVIEHVPDMVGWLRDVAQVLTWDGALLLAVPDRRYCFDVHRTRRPWARWCRRTSTATARRRCARCSTTSCGPWTTPPSRHQRGGAPDAGIAPDRRRPPARRPAAGR